MSKATRVSAIVACIAGISICRAQSISGAVPAAAAEYYGELKAAGVKAELHIYLTAGHGFGMTGRNPAFANLPVAHWPEQLRQWMAVLNFLHPV